MRKEMWSIVVAVSVGIFIGAVVSDKIAETFFYGNRLWILGAFVGGFVAYILFDVAEVARIVKREWKRVVAVSQHLRHWHPDFAYWKKYWTCVWYGTRTVTSLITAFIGTVILLATSGPGSTAPLEEVWFAGVIMYGVLLFSGVLIVLFCSRGTDEKVTALKKWAELVSIYQCIRRIGRALWFYSKLGVAVIPIIPEFLKRVFLAVHSEERVLCFIFAFAGTALAYVIGAGIFSLLTLCVLGGTFGAVYYEVVSVRLLKVVNGH